MASTDRYADAERTEATPPSRAVPGWLTQPVTWFGVALAGALLLFIGLYVDAWKHNNGAGEESLLSVTNPGHLIAGIGILVDHGRAPRRLHDVDDEEPRVRRHRDPPRRPRDRRLGHDRRRRRRRHHLHRRHRHHRRREPRPR